MAELSLEKAFGAVKRRDLSPAYLLTGAEDILKDELIAAILDVAVDPASRDFNVDVRSAGDLNGESLHALVETPPMLAERRVVVVHGIDQWRKNAKIWTVLRRYLEHPSPTTVLIMTHGGEQKPEATVAKASTTVAVDGLRPSRVRRWLVKRAKRADLVLEGDAADHLIAAVGSDLAHLAVEVEKLAAVVEADSALTASDVAEFVGVRRGETVHDWVDAVLAGDAARAISLIDVVLAQAGITAVQMVMSLGTALVGVRVARGLLDAGAAARGLERAVFQSIRTARPPGRWLRRWGVEAAAWAGAAQRWTTAEVDRAIAAAYDADKQLKSTTISDARGVLTTLLLRLAQPETA